MSVAGTIATAAVAGVNALATAGPPPGPLFGAPAAIARRAPSLPAGTTAPAIVVTVLKRGATEYLCVTAAGFADIHKYDGAVTLITPGADHMATDPVLEAWVEAVRKALQAWATWTPTLPTFNDVTMGETEYYSRVAADKTLNYCVQRFTVENIEAR